MIHRCAAYRISTLVVLLALFYSLDWMPLRVALRDVIGWCVRVSGYNPISFVHEGSPALSVEGCVHHYTAECTYLALLMTAAPLLWIPGASGFHNILRTAVAALVILSVNLLRCWMAVYLDVLGLDRFYAHDLPNFLIWCLTLTVVLVPVRRMRRNLRKLTHMPQSRTLSNN